MQANRDRDRFGEQDRQPLGAENLVAIVDSAPGDRVARPMDQMPIVVQQARDDQRGVRARLFGQQRTLQRVSSWLIRSPA